MKAVPSEEPQLVLGAAKVPLPPGIKPYHFKFRGLMALSLDRRRDLAEDMNQVAWVAWVMAAAKGESEVLAVKRARKAMNAYRMADWRHRKRERAGTEDSKLAIERTDRQAEGRLGLVPIFIDTRRPGVPMEPTLR